MARARRARRAPNAGDDGLRSSSAALVEIRRLQKEGDRLHRAAVASLFADGIDPMVVMRWKDGRERP